MSFKEIVLPHFLISNLYKDVLIEFDVNKEQMPKQNTSIVQENIKESIAIETSVNVNPLELKFLGENKKNISIILNDDEAVYINDNKLDFVNKLLLACKLSTADVAIVNISNTLLTFNDIKQHLTPSFLILFGINTKQFQLPLVLPEYKIQQHNNCQILIANNLNFLVSNASEVTIEKRKLWECLKQMFSV